MGEWVQPGWKNHNRPAEYEPQKCCTAPACLCKSNDAKEFPSALGFIAVWNETGKCIVIHSFISVFFFHSHKNTQIVNEGRLHQWDFPISLPFLHLLNHALLYPIFILFSPPLPSSISLFSTLLHWSLFKLILVLLPFPPSFPLRFPASWLMEDNFQYHNQSETRVNIDQKL